MGDLGHAQPHPMKNGPQATTPSSYRHMICISWRAQYPLRLDLWTFYFPHIHTHPLIKLPVVFQSSESLVVHIYTWYKEYFSHGIYSRTILSMDYIQARGGGVLVLAMVKFSKSPKTSKSSLSQLGEGKREVWCKLKPS